MKILQIGKFHRGHSGGVEQVIFQLLQGLHQEGISCDWLCASHSTKTYQTSFSHGKIIHTASFGMWARTMISPGMILWLHRHIRDYDVIHIHHPDPMAALALLLAPRGGKKIVLHWHSDVIKQWWAMTIFTFIQKRLLALADQLVTTSPPYLQESPYLQEVKDKATVIPIGLEASDLLPRSDVVKRIRRVYQGKKIVFSLGRLVYYKGFEYLIQAAQDLDDSFVILIGGTGPRRQRLEREIVSLGLKDKVILLGKIPQEELASYYRAADVFVLPSIEHSEAFGLVLIEAMSQKTPCVATTLHISGTAWVNQDGETGLNVPPKDSQALAEAIEAVLDKREDYAEAAWLRFHRLFTREAMVGKCLELYARLLG